ncbi:MAG: hypothetical protein QNJ16_19785 [Rhodobacter sp.]|nr:hypothetical protein [Rhodobacter sp.]
MEPRPPFAARALWLGLTVLVTAGMFRVFYEYHQNWQAIADLTFGVVEGRPHWRAFQNRLLAPFMAQGAHVLGLTRFDAVIAVTALLLLLHNLVLYALLRRAGEAPRAAFLWVLIFAFLFLVFQDHRWFLPWDAVEMVVVTLTAYVLYFGRPVVWLYPLFAVALFNRESALFLALIIVACGISLGDLTRLRLTVLDRRHVFGGAVLLVAGMALTKALRDMLFIESPIVGADAANATFGNHFRLLENLREVFGTNLTDRNALFTTLLILFLAVLLRGFRAAPEPKLRGTLFALMFLAGVFAFGIFNETRMLVPLITVFIFHAISPPKLL